MRTNLNQQCDSNILILLWVQKVLYGELTNQYFLRKIVYFTVPTKTWEKYWHFLSRYIFQRTYVSPNLQLYRNQSIDFQRLTCFAWVLQQLLPHLLKIYKSSRLLVPTLSNWKVLKIPAPSYPVYSAPRLLVTSEYYLLPVTTTREST